MSNEELVKWWKEPDAAEEPAVGPAHQAAESAHPAGSIALAALTGAHRVGYDAIPPSWVDRCPSWFGIQCLTAVGGF